MNVMERTVLNLPCEVVQTFRCNNAFKTMNPVQRFWLFSLISAAVCPVPIPNWTNCANNSKDHFLSLK